MGADASVDAPVVDAAGGSGSGSSEMGSGSGSSVEPLVTRRYNVAGAAFTGTDYPGDWEADPVMPNTTGSGSGGGGGGGGGASTAICTGTGAGIDPPRPIAGTVDDALFSRQIFGLPTVTCHVPNLPSGTYDVTLLFGPIFYGGGANPACMFATRSQKFSIKLEDRVEETAFDLTAASNGCVGNGSAGSHPVTRTYTLAVTDGTLDIVLTAPAGDASMISAIQVIGHR